MTTISIKVSDKILDKVIWLLKQFKKKDLEIIEDPKSFNKNKQELQKALEALENGNEKLMSLEKFENKLC